LARSIEATGYQYVTSEYGSRSGTSGSATAVGYETTGFGTYVSTLASVGGSGFTPVTNATGLYAIGGACFASGELAFISWWIRLAHLFLFI